MNRVAVYCGSSKGATEEYVQAARRLGKELASRNIALVYGGASVGVMGAVANSVLENGGQAIGVMPRFLEEREISHKALTDLIIVETMHERKAKMAELVDGFITLPGGAGTMEEFFEVLTWAQIGLHKKPCGLLNTNHYYGPLVDFFSHMVDEQFMQERYKDMVIVEESSEMLLDRFEDYIAPGMKTYENQ
ncbi:LOG family protein [Radiobacillus deserti]|uniref:Cytokinin riboside 5'-monophosphate phosphoribohydrolase n=1 Tax=Radiobacillus deserti TaxID=2594883 RepID=A0A516KC51_9BACI|nr:TIGR00730 family Rossman fold protein [Radiobacillus deserti]QDP38979.1 TIGR00730 family Rossman fold protein [Radiobacillus deserti]